MRKWEFHAARLEKATAEPKAFRVTLLAVAMLLGRWGQHTNELIAAAASGQQYVGQARNPADMGSPYVPLDSWIYPAFARLAAMGYVPTAMLGMKPWTRIECARLLEEAEDRLDEPDANPPKPAMQTYKALREEFEADIKLLDGGLNKSAEIESVYTRLTGINGKPFTDGFDFGQTLYNDFGRPYEEGANAISGFTGWGAFGPLVGYVCAEYQHAPSAPPLPQAARRFISTNLGLPPTPALSTAQVNRMDMLEGLVRIRMSLLGCLYCFCGGCSIGAGSRLCY